ncbi:MAG: hypothetical protein LBD30_08465, partial [Verrucomicrobiales bacterium]|nr:hypothetical protein [Verrucomicrobiales bacterium]
MKVKLITILILSVTVSASAATYQSSFFGGDWFNASVWGGTGIPTSSDDVDIMTLSSSGVFVNYGKAEANKIKIQGLLTIDGNGELECNSVSDISYVSNNNLTIAGQGLLRITGTSSSFNNNGSIIVKDFGSLITNQSITNNGNFTASGSSQLQLNIINNGILGGIINMLDYSNVKISTLVVSGGHVNITNHSVVDVRIFLSIRGGGTVNISGNSVVTVGRIYGDTFIGGIDLSPSNTPTVLTVKDQALINSNYIHFGFSNSGNPYGRIAINLQGGTLETREIINFYDMTYDDPNFPSITLNLNGGTIRATADNADFFSNIGNLTISSENLDATRTAFTMEVNNGLTVSATNNFTFLSRGSTTRAFAKGGGGTLILSGTFDFANSDLAVNDGALVLANTVRDLGNLQIAADGALDLFGSGIIGALTVGGDLSSLGELRMTLNADGQADLFSVGGDVTVSGVLRLDALDTFDYGKQYQL